MSNPQVTIAVPCLNQGQFLDAALTSIYQQQLEVEVFVLDGGSTDNTLEIIRKWECRLAGWRSHADNGQAAAINEGIASGSAPYVCWLNADDWYLSDGLITLIQALKDHIKAPAAYGRAWNIVQKTGQRRPVWVEAFSEKRLALRCIISQPATLIRRSAWESIGGVDSGLHMAMDYDLWWRLYRQLGPLHFVDAVIATNRDHNKTKTRTLRKLHYKEAISVVRKHHGYVPLKWWLFQPYAVWFKSVMS